MLGRTRLSRADRCVAALIALVCAGAGMLALWLAVMRAGSAAYALASTGVLVLAALYACAAWTGRALRWPRKADRS